MNNKKIGVIDYKAGNAPSVLNALNKLNIQAELINTPEQLKCVDAVILPGVGAARATMESLKDMNLLDTLNERVNVECIPFMGICVGLQILFDWSEEDNTHCLGWIHGKVSKFNTNVRIPQIGWNRVDFLSDDPILSDLDNHGYFYFVNSYFVEPDNKDIILGKTEYGIEFCSMIRYKNIIATQFHLEKSGTEGLNLLKNFIAKD